jgi:hypothetical protein
MDLWELLLRKNDIELACATHFSTTWTPFAPLTHINAQLPGNGLSFQQLAQPIDRFFSVLTRSH